MQQKQNAVVIVDVQNGFSTRGIHGKGGIPGSLAVGTADDRFVQSYITKIVSQILQQNVRYIALTKDWHEEGHVSFASTWKGPLFSNIKVDENGNGYFDKDGTIYKVPRTEGTKLEWVGNSTIPTNLSSFEKISKEKLPVLLDQTLWPDHCIQGSNGAELHPEMQKFIDFLKNPNPDTKRKLSFIPTEVLDQLSKVQGIKIEIFLKGDDINKECYSGTGGHIENGTKKLETALVENQIGQVFVGGLALDYCVCGTANGLQNSKIVKEAGVNVVVDTQTTMAVSKEAGITKLFEMSMNGITIPGNIPALLEGLPSKLPLDIAIAANQKNILPTSDIGIALSKLPKLSELDQATKTNFFTIYAKEFEKNNTNIPELDSLKLQLSYLRFIVQDIAEKSVIPGLVPDDKKISLQEWVDISQQVFGDAGTNISLPGVIGLRQGKDASGNKREEYGALAGGLGEKLTAGEFQIIQNKLKNLSLSENKKGSIDGLSKQMSIWHLEKHLAHADNVSYNINTQQYTFLDRNKPDDNKKIQAKIVTRETFEELGEGFVVKYLLSGAKLPFEHIMASALKIDRLSPKAKSVLDEIPMTVEEFMGENIDPAKIKNKDNIFGYRAAYKFIEEHQIPQFLKSTIEGQQLVADMYKLISDTKVKACIVTDLSFPKSRLDTIAKIFDNTNPEYAKLNDEQKRQKALDFINNPARPTVLIPQSTSYIGSPILGSLLDSFSKSAITTMQETDIKDLCLECKGFKKYPTANEQAADMLVLMGKGLFTYAHEGFIQIQNALGMAYEEAIAKGTTTEKFRKDFSEKLLGKIVADKINPVEYQNTLYKQMQRLIDGKIHISAIPEALSTFSQVSNSLLLNVGNSQEKETCLKTCRNPGNTDFKLPDISALANAWEKSNKVLASSKKDVGSWTKKDIEKEQAQVLNSGFAKGG